MMPFILTSKSKAPFRACHALKGAFLILVSVVLFFNEASPARAKKIETRPIDKECKGAKLLSRSTWIDGEDDILASSPAETIQLAHQKSDKGQAGLDDGPIEITAVGPILGSMDSQDMNIDVACTNSGVALTAILTRSANYDGDVLKNIPWRPRIRVTLVLHQPEIAFQSIWRMRLTDGVEVDHARTPWYPEEKFPIVLSQTIR